MPRVRLPLLLILLAGFAWTALYVLRIKQYFVQPDELEYVKQALRIGQQWHPITSGDRYFTSWSQLQPLLPREPNPSSFRSAPAHRRLAATHPV